MRNALYPLKEINYKFKWSEKLIFKCCANFQGYLKFEKLNYQTVGYTIAPFGNLEILFISWLKSLAPNYTYSLFVQARLFLQKYQMTGFPFPQNRVQYSA